MFPYLHVSMIGPLDPYISHANCSLYIREVSSVSGWITDPCTLDCIHTPGSLLSQVCRFAPSQSQSGNWIIQKHVKNDAPNLFWWKFPWCSQLLPTVCTLLLVVQNTTTRVQSRSPSWAKCSRHSHLLCSVCAMPRSISVPTGQPRGHRAAVQDEVTQCHPPWLRERHQISLI